MYVTSTPSIGPVESHQLVGHGEAIYRVIDKVTALLVWWSLLSGRGMNSGEGSSQEVRWHQCLPT